MYHLLASNFCVAVAVKCSYLFSSTASLTTHSTGAESACLSSRTWMLFVDASRPVNSSVRCFALSREDMRMRLNSLINRLLMMSIVLLVSGFVALNASNLQSKISPERRISSCREVKKLYPELEKLSDDELRKYLSEKFLSRYKSNPIETYTYAKYYVCRYHNDNSEQFNYMKKWIAAFEKKLKDKDSR
jgi:hypothetical protein